MDKLLILEEADSEAGIAYLSEGPGAPAMILIVSWSTIEDAQTGMEQIDMCGAWQIWTQDSLLAIIGYGQLVVIADGTEAYITYTFSWEMDDPYAVSFFAQQARTQGYFLLLPAVNKMPGSGAPVPCYLV